jgi:hypothetical protein
MFFLLVAAVVQALRARDNSERTLLAMLAAAVLAFFTFSATRKPVEANWPAIAWLPAVVVLASSRRGARSPAERLGVTIAAVTCIVSIVHVFYPIYPVAAKRDPAARGHGWREAAMELEAQGQRLAELTPNVHLAANRYQDASLFAYHLPGHPEVYALNLTSRHNQYDLWPTFRDRAAPGHALMIILQDRPDSVEPAAIRALRPHFSQVNRLDRLVIRRGDEEVTARRPWLLLDWRGTWPADAHSLTFIDGKPAPNGTRDD